MKQLIIVIGISFLIAACNDTNTTMTSGKDSTVLNSDTISPPSGTVSDTPISTDTAAINSANAQKAATDSMK